MKKTPVRRRATCRWSYTDWNVALTLTPCGSHLRIDIVYLHDGSRSAGTAPPFACLTRVASFIRDADTRAARAEALEMALGQRRLLRHTDTSLN